MYINPSVMRWVIVGLFGLVTILTTVRITDAQNTVDCGATVAVQAGDTLSLIAARQSDSQVSYQAISDVPVEYSQTLNTQLQAVAGTVEYYEYVGDNHNLSVNFNTAMARSIAFFDQYLK